MPYNKPKKKCSKCGKMYSGKCKCKSSGNKR